jgi:hypothetical protein
MTRGNARRPHIQAEAVLAGGLPAIDGGDFRNQRGRTLRRSMAEVGSLPHACPRLRFRGRHKASRASSRGAVGNSVKGTDAIAHDSSNATRSGTGNRARRRTPKILRRPLLKRCASEKASRGNRAIAQKRSPIHPESPGPAIAPTRSFCFGLILRHSSRASMTAKEFARGG